MGMMKKAEEILESGSIEGRYLAAVYVLHESGRQDFAYFSSRYGLSLAKLERLYHQPNKNIITTT